LYVGGVTATSPVDTASSMLSRMAAQPPISALRMPLAAPARNSAQHAVAAGVHCTDVCCGLNFTTCTCAPQRAH
jgi:hypothetical protein